MDAYGEVFSFVESATCTNFCCFSLLDFLFLCSQIQGVLFPCNHAIWSRWAPLAERTTLVTVSITGWSAVALFAKRQSICVPLESSH